MANSFIENVNIVANATQLSSGDIIEDAELARNEAVAAAERARISALDADVSELKSEEWSQKAYNNEVEPGKFSSFHWSEKSRLNAGDQLINDIVISQTTVWSSQKVSTELSTKANENHLHPNVYEPVFQKNTAFNKSFGGTGASSDIARSDHTHSQYELVIQEKNTAFNKNFGLNAGEVAEGNHIHDYEPVILKNTAFNKSFIADLNNPLDDEIPRGTHTHKATNIVYDPTNNNIITSSTTQGALGQLDGKMKEFSTAERTNISVGMASSSETVAFSAVGEPVKILVPTFISAGSKNALYSDGAVKINYAIDPTKLIEGWYTFTITIVRKANTKYSVYAYRGANPIDDSFKINIGSDVTEAGTNQVSLDGFMTGLLNNEELSVYIANDTDTATVDIIGMTVSFAAVPEGAIVASGISVDHADLTGTGAPNGAHTISDIIGLESILDTKATLPVTPTTDSIVTFDAAGLLYDSNIDINTVSNKMDKINSPTPTNFISMDATGNAQNSGVSEVSFALVAGDNSKTFNVADGTGTEAINKNQLDAFATTVDTTGALTAHIEDTANPHIVTYTQIGAAAEIHTHIISDVSLLQDSLNDKYNKVSTPATDNIVSFETGGLLKDSGVAFSEITSNSTAITTLQTDSHSHTNKTLLDTITDTGDGMSYLANDGIYKTVVSSTDWSDITNKPTKFPPEIHTHVISDVINLQTTLDSKEEFTQENSSGTPATNVL
ncbi:MAG: hypothetical protein DRG30_08720, partial [Epsilonproteobacteria bacterium]